LSADNSVHISLHQLLFAHIRSPRKSIGRVKCAITYLNQIDLCERFITSGLLDIKNGDDVLMIEVSQQLHLTQGTQAEHGVVEWGNLLDRNLLARRLVQGRAVEDDSGQRSSPLH
jgi:hypothetical protein